MNMHPAVQAGRDAWFTVRELALLRRRFERAFRAGLRLARRLEHAEAHIAGLTRGNIQLADAYAALATRVAKLEERGPPDVQ